MGPKYTPFNHHVEDDFLYRIDPTGSINTAKIDLNNHEAVKQYITEIDNALWAARYHHNEIEQKHTLLIEKLEALITG